MKRVGIDLDNTIICYDHSFSVLAKEKGLPGGFTSKQQIRDFFRGEKKEAQWTEMQGQAYGARIDLAEPFEGVNTFFEQCAKRGICISIISHKTKFPYAGPQFDLHSAARGWLEKYSFFTSGIELYFECTIEEKLSRIGICDLFIDDLPEVLAHSMFPQGVQRVLFDPRMEKNRDPSWKVLRSWRDGLELLNL
jgi:hypothetical protein